MKIEEELRYQGNRIDNGETVYGTPYFDSHGIAFILLEDEKAIPGLGGQHGEQCRFTSKYNHTLNLHIPAFEVDEATIRKA